MKFPPGIPVFGDTSYRGPCPPENSEQVTAIAEIRRRWPATWGKLVLHPANEGARSWGQAAWAKAGGLTPGASDIIIPAACSFVCEIKRRDHTKSKWQPGQVEYLEAAQAAGCFVCVALGWEAVLDAVNTWIKSTS
jgi:hypothetical protein